MTIPALPDSEGGVSFVGFTDPDSFSTVTLTSSSDDGSDYIGIDDLQFSIPEPSTLALFASAGVVLLFGRWRARRSSHIADSKRIESLA